jgi:hypothetical protein
MYMAMPAALVYFFIHLPPEIKTIVKWIGKMELQHYYAVAAAKGIWLLFIGFRFV